MGVQALTLQCMAGLGPQPQKTGDEKKHARNMHVSMERPAGRQADTETGTETERKAGKSLQEKKNILFK